MTKRKSGNSKHSSSHYDDANPSDSSSGEETTNSIGDDGSASSQQQETETINDLSDHTKRLFDAVTQMMRNHLREATRVVSTKNNNKRQRRVQEEEDTLLAASAAATVSPTTTTKATQQQQHSPTKTNHMDDESSSSSADNSSQHYPSDLATLLEDLPNDSWKKQFLELVRYQQEHNSLSKLRKDNPKLRSWCSSQKRNQRMGILPSQRFELLETIGFSWK